MASKHGLGRGLSALINETVLPHAATVPAGGATKVPISKIVRNPRQPRRNFPPETLEELAASIRSHGMLQPLLVRRKGEGYELIAGERRLRAAGDAGLAEVPVAVVDATDSDSLELALIENLQRDDLNPIEAAEGYRGLANEFKLTQEQIAQRVGKARVSVTNTMRLLDLPEEVQSLIAEGRLSEGHAKVLLGLENPEEQKLVAKRVVKEGLSVRSLENAVANIKRVGHRKRKVGQSDIPAEHMTYLSDILHRHFGTAIRITPCKTLANGKKAKGTIEIEFYSNEDLDRVLHLLGIQELS